MQYNINIIMTHQLRLVQFGLSNLKTKPTVRFCSIFYWFRLTQFDSVLYSSNEDY